MPRSRQGDIDAIRQALRPRMGSLGTVAAAAPTPTTVAPHTHSADQIGAEPELATALLAGDDAQEQLYELGTEKLARSGEQPMLGDLDMDDHEVDAITALLMTLDPTYTPAEGMLAWDTQSGVDRLVMTVAGDAGLARTPIGGVYARVRNVSGGALPSAASVVATSVDDATNLLQVEGLSYAHSLEDYLGAGVTIQPIADDAEGWVCFHGFAGGLDLSAFAAGDHLFAGITPGTMAAGPPLKGCGWRIKLGVVIVGGNPGSMWVEAEHRPNLDELSNMEVGSYEALKQDYDVPMWLPDPAEVGCYAWRDYPPARFPCRTQSLDYEVIDKDVVILIDASGADVEVTLPAATTASLGRLLRIKLKKGPFRAIIIPMGNTIDGEASVTLVAEGESLDLQRDENSDWRIL